MRNRARVLVITGSGKGKTTSALGTMLRGLAYGKRTLLTRFAKAAHSGELDMLGNLPNLTILAGKYGMTPNRDSPKFSEHVQAARDLFEATGRLAPEYDTLVMDEILGIVARDMVHESEVITVLDSLRPDQTAILTGRGATVGLIAAADTVSEVLCLKHGYRNGIAAQEGVEF